MTSAKPAAAALGGSECCRQGLENSSFPLLFSAFEEQRMHDKRGTAEPTPDRSHRVTTSGTAGRLFVSYVR